MKALGSMKALRSLLAALLAAGGLALTSLPGNSAAFFAWDVVDGSQSRILVGYPRGTTLSLTGRCTGGIDLEAIAGLPQWRQRQIVRGAWCEVWIDPAGNGNFRNGWVYGRYIAPQ
jgi:hypothetical protein